MGRRASVIALLGAWCLGLCLALVEGRAAAAGTPPTLSNLQFNPTSAPQGSGFVQVNGSLDFTDPDGDLTSITVTVLETGAVTTLLVPQPFPFTSGTVGGIFLVDTSVARVIHFTVQAFDQAGNASNILTGTFTVVAVPQAITVNLVGSGTGGVTSNPPGIACPPTCTANFPRGIPITFTAAPDAGAAVAWTGCDAVAGNVCTVTPNAPRIITVTFTADAITITVPAAAVPNPVASGGTPSLNVVAVDALGRPLTYAWTAACPVLGSNGSFDHPASPSPFWTAPANLSGSLQTCTIQVTVSNGQGLTKVSQFVEGVNPTATSNLTVFVVRTWRGRDRATVGHALRVVAVVQNLTVADFGPTPVTFYLSPTPGFKPAGANLTLGQITLPGLASGARQYISRAFTVPALTPGTYYLAAVGGSGLAAVWARPITIRGGP